MIDTVDKRKCIHFDAIICAARIASIQRRMFDGDFPKTKSNGSYIRIVAHEFDQLSNDPRIGPKLKASIDWSGCNMFLAELKLQVKRGEWNLEE